MPGNRLSPRWILQIRFCRSSSLTVRLPSMASENELLRSRPRVRGNSKVDLDTHPPLSAIVAEDSASDALHPLQWLLWKKRKRVVCAASRSEEHTSELQSP